MRLEARLANVRALHAAAAIEYCNYLLSPDMMPYFLDNFGLQLIGEPLRDNGGVERQRFTHVWPGIRVYLPQPPESSNGTNTGVQTLFWNRTDRTF